jgi:hypothetical protein
MHKWRILRLVLCARSTNLKPTTINEHPFTLNFFRNNRCLARFTNGKCISEAFYLGCYVLWVPKWSPRQSPIRPTAGMWVGFYASLMDFGDHLCFTNGKCISEEFYVWFYVLRVPKWIPQGATSVEESARTDANNNYKRLIIEEQPQLSCFVLLQEYE